jgi:hypothetical protein
MDKKLIFVIILILVTASILIFLYNNPPKNPQLAFTGSLQPTGNIINKNLSLILNYPGDLEGQLHSIGGTINNIINDQITITQDGPNQTLTYDVNLTDHTKYFEEFPSVNYLFKNNISDNLSATESAKEKLKNGQKVIVYTGEDLKRIGTNIISADTVYIQAAPHQVTGEITAVNRDSLEISGYLPDPSDFSFQTSEKREIYSIKVTKDTEISGYSNEIKNLKQYKLSELKIGQGIVVYDNQPIDIIGRIIDAKRIEPLPL